MTSERAVWIVGLMFALASGCADLSRGPAVTVADAGAGEGGAPETDGGVSFAANVEGLLVASCQHCHSTGGEAGDTTFLLGGDPSADFAAATRFVDVNAPASSRLLAKMSGNGHGGGTVHAAGTPEYQTVLTWIQEGAQP
jgi:hypothetical protein